MLQSLLEALPWSTVSTLSVSAVFTGLVWSGKLVPRSWVDKASADQEARIADQAERIAFLEQANGAQSGHIGTLATQNGQLTVSSELSVALLHSLQQLSAGNHASRSIIEPHGSGHVAPSIEQT